MTAATVDAIHRLLSQYRFRGRHEKDYQQAIEDVLIAGGLTCQREVRLSSRDIIDFMVDDVGVEVKVDGSRSAIIRQLGRYAESDQVKALVLVSSRPTLTANLPTMIHEVPVTALSLRGAFL